MDSLHSEHSLDGTNRFRRSRRFRSPMHLLALLQLSCRRFSALVSAFPDDDDDVDADTSSRAASTVAANIMLRSAIAAGFPLFSRQMFANLGVQWAGTLLACIATIAIPIPVGLNKYGPALRKKSKILAT